MKPKTSYVWTYFTEVDSETAECKICNKIYSRKGRGTTSLKNHLRSAHPCEFVDFTQQDEKTKKKKLEGKDKPVSHLQNAEKQTTLQEEIDKLITEMIALQDLPFDFVEGVGFRRVIQAALPHYHLKGSQFFMSNMYYDVNPKLATKIKELLKDINSLSFSADIWSEPNTNISLLSITCHGITADFRRISLMLKCERLEGCYTGDNIAEKFIAMLAHWEIPPEKLHCVIRNGNSNLASRLLHFNDIDCTVHQIQLCIQAALESEDRVTKLVTKCKLVASHFNKSTIAQEELKHIQAGLNEYPLSVVQDCPTKWNSTFYLMQRLLQIKDALNLYATEHDILEISPDDWLEIEKCVRILKPFEETTKVMTNSQASISSVIPLIFVLKSALKEENKSDTTQVFKNIIRKLNEELNDRFGELQNNNLYALATYLDPRYKLKFFNEIFKDKVHSEMLLLIGGTDNSSYGPPSEKKQRRDNLYHDTNQPSTSSQAQLSQNEFSIDTFLADILNTNSDEDEDGCTNKNLDQYMVIKALLLDYNKEKRINIDQDPLLWWKHNRKYRSFFNTVCQYLSPPPASVANDKFFEGVGELRNSLKTDEAEKLLFIKYNLPLLNFEY